MARFPKIRVTVQSENPLALVAAVRQGMRLARVDPRQIQRFTDQALAADNRDRVEHVCSQWVRVQAPEE